MERLIGLIAPLTCISCGAEGEAVCVWCLPDIASIVPERCYRCHGQTPGALVCKSCRSVSRIKHVWVRTDYDGPAKKLIHDFKFERLQAAAKPIAGMLAEILPVLPAETILCNVPTASGRVRQRGYDQSQLIAKELANLLGFEYKKLLHRSGQTRQVGANREERLMQLSGSFKAINAKDAGKRPVLLVDDLVTTGGTIESAARCLKAAGIKQVDAVVFAQKK